MHLSALRSSQIYLSSVIVTTVSSGTLACSTVALSLCGVKCVCVCVCVCSLSQAIALFALEFRIYLWITHICCPQLLRLQITIHTNTLPPPQHSAPRVCVCVCIPVLWKAFSPLHSLMITHTHTHTHSWGYVQAGMSSSQQPNYSDWPSDFLIEGLQSLTEAGVPHS